MLQRTQPVRNIFRQNAVTGEWVVFAMGRKDRPKQTIVAKTRQKGSEMPKHDPSCPFCPGNEHITPPTLLQYGTDLTTTPYRSDSGLPNAALLHLRWRPGDWQRMGPACD